MAVTFGLLLLCFSSCFGYSYYDWYENVEEEYYDEEYYMWYYLQSYNFDEVYYNGTINGTYYVCTNLDLYFEDRKRNSWWDDVFESDDAINDNTGSTKKNKKTTQAPQPPIIHCYRACNE